MGEFQRANSQGETCLARAADAGQGDQSVLSQETAYRDDFLVSTDETRPFGRQVVRSAEGPQWGELRRLPCGRQLEKPLRLPEVLQPMLAEIRESTSRGGFTRTMSAHVWDRTT